MSYYYHDFLSRCQGWWGTFFRDLDCPLCSISKGQILTLFHVKVTVFCALYHFWCHTSPFQPKCYLECSRQKSWKILQYKYQEMFTQRNRTFATVCHKKIGTGNRKLVFINAIYPIFVKLNFHAIKGSEIFPKCWIWWRFFLSSLSSKCETIAFGSDGSDGSAAALKTI